MVFMPTGTSVSSCSLKLNIWVTELTVMDTITVTDSKLEAITQAPPPNNVQQLRSFLGLLNYYCKFIPNLASLIHPLDELLQKDRKWKWSKECDQCFRLAKEKLICWCRSPYQIGWGCFYVWDGSCYFPLCWTNRKGPLLTLLIP